MALKNMHQSPTLSPADCEFHLRAMRSYFGDCTVFAAGDHPFFAAALDYALRVCEERRTLAAVNEAQKDVIQMLVSKCGGGGGQKTLDIKG